MNDSLLFEKLEQYALSYTRFTASPTSDDDFREQYVQVLNKKGYSEGDYIFDEYMNLVDTAKYKIEKFIKRYPLSFAIIALRNDLMRRYFQYDKRDPDSEIYTSDCIFYADAINSSEEMIEFLNRMMMDWIFAIKNNLSNSVAVVAIKNYLNEHKDTCEYFHCEKVDKTGGRIEVRRYDIIPISAVEPCQQALLKPGTKSLIRVEKETYSHLKDDNKNIKEEKMKEAKPTSSTLYFISSLDYNDDNCKQIVHSLRHRWLYESQHNTLDTVMLQDSQHCCDENHLAAITGLNSMVYNIVSFARQKMSTRGYTNVAHRNADTAKTAPLITYSRVFSIFKQHPLVAIQYLDEYFNTPPVED